MLMLYYFRTVCVQFEFGVYISFSLMPAIKVAASPPAAAAAAAATVVHYGGRERERKKCVYSASATLR